MLFYLELLVACSKDYFVRINGENKIFSEEFIDVITKRKQNTVKMGVPQITPAYEINYDKENIKVYVYEGNVLVNNKTDWYTVSNEEYKTIQDEAR